MSADWSEKSVEKRRNEFRKNYERWAAGDPAAASEWKKMTDQGIVELLTGGAP